MSKRLEHVLAFLLLGLMFVLAGGAMLRESVTVDEVAHIGAGLSYVQKLDMRMNPEHPPLAKVLAGIPLAIRGTYADYSHISWTFSRQFFAAYMGQWVFGEWVLSRWNRPERTLLWARLPMLLLTLLLGWVIYVYGSRLGGSWGGLLALSVYVSAPVFLTFGPLVLTDIAVTLFSLLSLWTFARLWVEASRRHIAAFAFALAGTFLAKFSAPLLALAILVVIVTTRWWPIAGQPLDRAEARVWRRLRWRAVLKSTGLAAAIVYVVYFVLSWNQPLDPLTRLGTGPVATAAERLLMPPWLYLRGLAFVSFGSVRPTFLFGRIYTHGVPFYFPVVAFFKSPPAFLALLALTAAAGVLLRRRTAHKSSLVPEHMTPYWRVLWVGLVAITVECLFSPMTISIRHFTLPLVLLILMTALLPRAVARLSPRTYVTRTLGCAVGLLAGSSIATAILIYPNYFPYTNALALRSPAYWVFSDSNVDWNQALPEVARFADSHGAPEINVDTYSLSDPSATVPKARIWDCQAPSPADAGKWAAVSANMLLDAHNCEWLTRYAMQPLAGGSMYAVRLPAPMPEPGTPGGPPVPSERRLMWGIPFDLRAMFIHVSRQPDQLPAVYADLMKRFEEYQRESAGARAAANAK